MPRTNTGIYLDVDQSIVENNLRFTRNSDEEAFEKLFKPETEDPYPSKLVRPTPGFCIKAREIGTNRKVFVNVCQTSDIPPPPKDYTELELQRLLEDDENVPESGDLSAYRIPMSIGELRPATSDTNPNESIQICDVAINPKFFNKMHSQPLFKQFFTCVVFDGLHNKYGLTCQDVKTILQNRKSVGNLQMHRIQNREICEKMNTIEAQPKIQVLNSSSVEPKQPEYRLYFDKNQTTVLIGEFQLPDVINTRNLTVDVGEDRIVIEESNRNYFLDIYVPHSINQKSCSSNFDKFSRVLTITMPLLGG